jgi:hypothetical protein
MLRTSPISLFREPTETGLCEDEDNSVVAARGKGEPAGRGLICDDNGGSARERPF